MPTGSIGFIGGGRITRIILKGFQNAGIRFNNIVVSDISAEILNALKRDFPDISVVQNDNQCPAGQDLVFISLHPPVMAALMQEIRPFLKPESIVVSLAPKFTVSKLTELLGGFGRIIRMNPSAPSVVNSGFNPVYFSDDISEDERSEFMKIMEPLGDTPVVAEEKIEAYALFTAMGPTYFWFQFYELTKIVEGFGLNEQEISEGLGKMLNGTLKTMISGMEPDEVMDLVPVRPIGEGEEMIKNLYREKLSQIYARIKP